MCCTARQLLSAVGSVGFHTVRESPPSSGCEERVILVPAPRVIFLNRFRDSAPPLPLSFLIKKTKDFAVTTIQNVFN